jgi:hypothetical protein
MEAGEDRVILWKQQMKRKEKESQGNMVDYQNAGTLYY